MKLEGSCHCKVVRFEVESFTPYPFMYCYCFICRKTAGGSGSAINIIEGSRFTYLFINELRNLYSNDDANKILSVQRILPSNAWALTPY